MSSKNIRLKIISILFAFFYFFIIGEYVYSGIPDFASGFQQGRDDARNKHKASGYKSPKFFSIEVNPTNGRYTFPTSLANLKTGEFIQADLRSFSVRIANPAELGIWFNIAIVFEYILSFVVFFLLIYIPIQAYKTIRSIVKNEIFDLRTISRIRRIGYALLIIFGYGVYYIFIDYLSSTQMISLKDYDIIFSVKSEYTSLLFGLITLLFAEILKISHTMKEEQDLTI